MFDGGADVHRSLNLSGEPIVPQVAASYGRETFQAASASEIAATNVAKREYQKDYMEYWNSTKDLTGVRVFGFLVPSFIISPEPQTMFQL